MRSEKRIRNINWIDYGISKNRYEELKSFCKQYEEKKSKIKYGLSSNNCDGMPHSNEVGNPTERNAINNSIYADECKMIEEAAIRTNPIIYRYLLKSVTMGLSYEEIEYDRKYGRIPMCRSDFYGYRRLFFHYLDKFNMEHKINQVS